MSPGKLRTTRRKQRNPQGCNKQTTQSPIQRNRSDSTKKIVEQIHKGEWYTVKAQGSGMINELKRNARKLSDVAPEAQAAKRNK